MVRWGGTVLRFTPWIGSRATFAVFAATLMQIALPGMWMAEQGRAVRIVPDVAVSGATTGTGLTEGLLGLLMLRSQVDGKGSGGNGGMPQGKTPSSN
jgi:hypothetical protein